MSHIYIYIYQGGGSYQMRDKGTEHGVVSGQGNGPGTRGPKNHRITLMSGPSSVYHLLGPLTHLPSTAVSGMWRPLENKIGT